MSLIMYDGIPCLASGISTHNRYIYPPLRLANACSLYVYLLQCIAP